MDEFDRAQQLEEAEREAAIRAQQAKLRMVACGACHNCNEPLPPGMLFCDRDCRDDYEKRQPRGR